MSNDKYIVPDDFTRYRVNRQSPCPICGKPDWCLSDGVAWAICQRVEGGECWYGRGGQRVGWFHRLDESKRNTYRPIAPIVVELRRNRQFSPASATYYYVNEAGENLYRKHRYDKGRIAKNRKVFIFEKRDGGDWLSGPGCLNGVRRVPYRLDQVIVRQQVFVVEGEKCADAMGSAGFMATCSDSGSASWGMEHASALIGKDVVVLPDNDDPGREYAQTVMDSLRGSAASIRLVNLPGLDQGEDVFDWLALGHTAIDLGELVIASTPLEINASARVQSVKAEIAKLTRERDALARDKAAAQGGERQVKQAQEAKLNIEILKLRKVLYEALR